VGIERRRNVMAEDRFIRETPLARILNRLMGAMLRLGIAPGYMRLLEVRGRKSGKVYATPVNLLEMNGRTYLVAARGQTAWARNARAAGRATLRRGARATVFVARELADAEKPAVLKAFLDRYSSQVQQFFSVQAGSPADAFASMAPSTPVFELTPESGKP
jgi:deazaflavin-dependent oxidoreductase (nitroreductase family)